MWWQNSGDLTAPRLMKNCISEFGISHWNEDYIKKMDGDTSVRISPYGRPLSGLIDSTYTEFFEKYKKNNYYTCKRQTFGTCAGKSWDLHWKPDDGTSKIYSNPASFETIFQTEINIPKEVAEYLDIKWTIFFAGNKSRGALPHHHSAALNILCVGNKRWFLFNASPSNPMGERLQEYYYSAYPFNNSNTSDDWFESEYETSLKEYKENGGKVYEFIQEAGDVVFIPEHWSHTTINLGDVLGISLFDSEGSTYI